MTFYDDKAATINALQGAVLAIENELGITPAGIYASVRTRLDILESRINNPLSPSPQVNNPFFIGNTGVTISTGLGFPTENRIPGSLYLREDGYNIEGLYARRPDGYWHRIDTDPFTAAGDLSGTIYTQTVVGLQNHAINPNASLLQTDSAGDGYVLTWNATANSGTGWWEPQIGFFAYGDLSGTKVNQTVSNLQGTKLTIGTMSATRDGYVLTWNNTSNQWEPQRSAVVFDALDNSTTTNIRSNRYLTQSPIDNTKSGIVNLSSRSTGTTTGVTANYSAILGGDQNQVASAYSTIVGGQLNLVSLTGVLSSAAIVGGQSNVINSNGSQSFIGAGSSNAVSGVQSAIVGGTSNQTTGSQNYIVGGVSNLTSGTQSFIGGGNANSITTGNYGLVVNGQLNSVSGSFSSVLNGFGHSISAARSFILDGVSNTIDLTGTFVSILNGSNNTVHSLTDGYSLIATGYLNTIQNTSQYGSILNGNNNIVSGNFSTIISGNSNTISGSNSTTLGGTNSSVSGNYSLTNGNTNTVSSNNSIVLGSSNTAYLNSNFVTIVGDTNLIGQTNAAPYSVAFGSNNVVLDGYSSVFGYSNTINPGANYSCLYGQSNYASSEYSNIWGGLNQIGASSYSSTIFGANNNVGIGQPYSFIVGLQNTISGSGLFNSAWGRNNNVVTSSSGFNSACGNYNSVTGDWNNAWGGYNTVNIANGYANAFGYYNTISSVAAFVHGQYAKATNFAQYSHAGQTFGGTTAGTSQFARILLSGSASAGGLINLYTNGTNNIVTEDGKSYDMSIRVVVVSTSGTATRARYIFNVLAHQESGTLVIDNLTAVSIDDNGTNWVGNNWTSMVTASSNNLIVTVPNSGAQNRRAFATVEWSELTRL